MKIRIISLFVFPLLIFFFPIFTTLATPPTFISENETVWNSTASPKNSGTFAVQTNDIIVVYGFSEDNPTELTRPTFTTGGAGMTFEIAKEIGSTVSGHGYIWTVKALRAENLVVQTTGSLARLWGFNTLVFRNSYGVGFGSHYVANDSLPQTVFHTTQADSAVVSVWIDNEAGTVSDTWLTNVGTFIELTSYDDASYSIHGGYYPDVSLATSTIIGLTSPTAPDFGIIAIEVLGINSTSSMSTTTIFDTASSTAVLGSIAFGLNIIIVLIFIAFCGYIFNKFTPKKAWQ